MHIALFVKVIYWIQILLKKIILYCFSYTVIFRWAKLIFDSSFLLKKKFKHWLIYKGKLK